MSQSQKYCPYCGTSGERFLSPESVATVLDCSVETVRGWIKAKVIGSIKIGRLRRIPYEEIEKIIIDFPAINQSVRDILRR